MALITSRASLNQGLVGVVADMVFTTGVGADIGLDSVGSNLPALAAGEYFEVRGHSQAANNGLYQVVTVNTSTSAYEVNKISPGTPVVAGTESATTLGATGASTEKSVHFDVANLQCYGIEQGNMDPLGVEGGAMYSFFMQEWKEDNFLIANAPFPMNAIDTDAGKYIMGQDSSGNSNGWNWIDLSGETPAIRTRKLLRNMGWNEIDAAGITIAREFCAISLGTFEDETPLTGDLAFYQFGTDTLVDDTVDMTFTGPVNEAIRFYEEQLQTDLAITATTITRVGGSFITEGYKVGGQVTIRNAETPANNGTWDLTAVSATVLTTAGLTIDAADIAARLSVNNDNAFRIGIRVRDADTNGKTFGESNLAGAGKSILGNFVFSFPLANATDLKITATDAAMAGAPYSGMSITFFAAGQSRGGLVGGPYNFGIIVDGNNGTNIQVFEFIQYSLRLLTDIDADGDIAIGRTIGLLARFNGDLLELGSGNGGLTFPINPDGGGSGVFIDNLNAASDNATQFYDNTGVIRAKPEAIAITLDGNSIVIDDTASEYDLFFDRTIHTDATVLLDLVIGVAGGGQFTSVGADLPNNAEIAVGKYVRVAGLTGADAAMNGIYQITAETTPGSDWTVVRQDGQTIVAVTTTAADIDQNCIDTPDALIVHTNVNTSVSADVSFTAPDTITSAGLLFGIFAVGDRIQIEGSTGGLNDGYWEVLTQTTSVMTLSPERAAPAAITTQGTGPTVTVTKLFSGDMDADKVFNFAFDDNVQGGRTVSTSTFVKAKAIGQLDAQYIESPVSTIVSGTPLTIPLFSATERNVT